MEPRADSRSQLSRKRGHHGDSGGCSGGLFVTHLSARNSDVDQREKCLLDSCVQSRCRAGRRGKSLLDSRFS